MNKLSEAIAQIKPFVIGWISESAGGVGPYAPSPHDLSSAHHSGSLADSQMPNALLRDGSRSLLGNLAVAETITIDGVDLSAFRGAYDTHVTAPAAHHDPVTIGTGGLSAKLGLATQVLTLGAIAHSDLSTVTADQHHNQVHVLAGTDHTASGLTAGWVLRASGTTTFAWAQLGHGDLGSVTADQHHNQSHVLATTSGLGADHSTSGLTAGYVLRASGATTAAFAQLQHTDLGGVSADQHHAGFIGLEDNAATAVTPATDDHIQLTTANNILSIAAGTNTVGFTVNQGNIDHGSIGGLTDDDHTRYAEHAAAETITGGWQWSISLLPSLTDTYDIGSSTKLWRKGWLSELESILFVQNSVQVTGGWWMVPHASGTLAADVNDSQTTIDFGTAMTPNDFVILRGNLLVEYMQVGTLVSGTTYNVTRNLDGTGANAWPQGQVFVNLGYSGDGRIEFDAQTAGPRVSVFEHGTSYNVQTERVRIGDLNGWGPIATSVYGWAAGDYAGGQYAYYAPGSGLVISGNVTATSGLIGGFTVNATDGLYAGTGATRVQMKPGGGFWAGATARVDAPFSVTEAGVLVATSATITGVITANTGYIGGASGWVIAAGKMTSTGIGLATAAGDATYAIWAGDNAPASAEFSVTHAGALVATNATITGAITATSGTIGGFTVNATEGLYAGTGATRVQMKPGAGFWAGADARDSAPFRVTQAGVLTATSATITGAITATSGELQTLSVTGKLTMSGTGSAIAIGATPPTSATAGTGIWIDRTGFYSLSSGTYQVKIDATTGVLYAAGGNILLDNSGLMFRYGGNYLSWRNASGVNAWMSLLVGTPDILNVATNTAVINLAPGETNVLNISEERVAITAVGLNIGGTGTVGSGNLTMSGSILASTPIWAEAYRNSTQSIPNASWTVVGFNVETYDTDGIWSSGDGSKFTATRAGLYVCNASIEMVGAGSPLDALISVYVNAQAMAWLRVECGSSSVNLSISRLIYLTAGQYVQFGVYQNSGNAWATNAASGTAKYLCSASIAKVA